MVGGGYAYCCLVTVPSELLARAAAHWLRSCESTSERRPRRVQADVWKRKSASSLLGIVDTALSRHVRGSRRRRSASAAASSPRSSAVRRRDQRRRRRRLPLQRRVLRGRWCHTTRWHERPGAYLATTRLRHWPHQRVVDDDERRLGRRRRPPPSTRPSRRRHRLGMSSRRRWKVASSTGLAVDGLARTDAITTAVLPIPISRGRRRARSSRQRAASAPASPFATVAPQGASTSRFRCCFGPSPDLRPELVASVDRSMASIRERLLLVRPQLDARVEAGRRIPPPGTPPRPPEQLVAAPPRLVRGGRAPRRSAAAAPPFHVLPPQLEPCEVLMRRLGQGLRGGHASRSSRRRASSSRSVSVLRRGRTSRAPHEGRRVRARPRRFRELGPCAPRCTSTRRRRSSPRWVAVRVVGNIIGVGSSAEIVESVTFFVDLRVSAEATLCDAFQFDIRYYTARW